MDEEASPSEGLHLGLLWLEKLLPANMPQRLIEGLREYTVKVSIHLHTRWWWQMAPNSNNFLSTGCFKRSRTVLLTLWQFDHISFQFIQLYKGWVIICSCHSVEFPCLCAFLGQTFQCTHAPSVPFYSTIFLIYCFLMCNKLNTILCSIIRLQKAAKLQNNTKIGISTKTYAPIFHARKVIIWWWWGHLHS